MNSKKHLSLTVALLVPLLFLCFIYAEKYYIRSNDTPEYNFLYGLYDSSSSQSQGMTTRNGKLVCSFGVIDTAGGPTCRTFENDGPLTSTQLFIFNTKNKTVTPVSYQKAAALNLYTSAISPDGYRINPGYNQAPVENILSQLLAADADPITLSGNNLLQRLTPPLPDGNGSNYVVDFFGWIKE